VGELPVGGVLFLLKAHLDHPERFSKRCSYGKAGTERRLRINKPDGKTAAFTVLFRIAIVC
jgi:hypothetical protein